MAFENSTIAYLTYQWDPVCAKIKIVDFTSDKPKPSNLSTERMATIIVHRFFTTTWRRLH